MTPKPNLLITGISGLLGGNLARRFSAKYNVFGIYRNNRPLLPDVELIKSDLCGEGAAGITELDDVSLNYVIHCAGEADVDVCERNPHRADRDIFQMTKSVSKLAAEHRAHFVYISTDAVSDGTREYRKEDDCPSPINVYGKTKVYTENYLLSEHGSSMIVRTRFYGINITKKKCFTEQLVSELRMGNEVSCLADSYCSQIYVTDLADILEKSMTKELFGIYNIVEDKKYSRFDYARLVARIFGLDEGLIVPCCMSDMNFLAPRPRDTSLSNAKIKKHIDWETMSAEKGLETMKMDMKKWH